MLHMRIFIDCRGDPSVGIPSEFAEVRMEVWDEGRETIREVLKEAFSEIWDEGRVYVHFEGEPGNGR